MRYIKGDDFQDADADHMTYGIDDLHTGHGNVIEVYRYEDLRDEILNLLNRKEERANEGLQVDQAFESKHRG